MWKLDGLHWLSQQRRSTPHFGRFTPQGAMTPKFELRRDSCTMHLPPKFHHPMFTRSEFTMLTNKQTHKQTPLKTSNALRYATTLGNDWSQSNILATINLGSTRSLHFDSPDGVTDHRSTVKLRKFSNVFVASRQQNKTSLMTIIYCCFSNNLKF